MTEPRYHLAREVNPHLGIVVDAEHVHYFAASEVTAFTFDDTVVDIDKTAPLYGSVPPQQIGSAILAAMGFSNYAISQKTLRSEHTVKTHMWYFFNHLRSAGLSAGQVIGRPSRAGLPRLLLQQKVFIPAAASGNQLGLSPAEAGILDLAASGYSNKQIAARRGGSPLTVKTHLSQIALRQEWRGDEDHALSTRTILSLAALLSGEVPVTAGLVPAKARTYRHKSSKPADNFNGPNTKTA